jgi:hypothetical protein
MAGLGLIAMEVTQRPISAAIAAMFGLTGSGCDRWGLRDCLYIHSPPGCHGSPINRAERGTLRESMGLHALHQPHVVRFQRGSSLFH